MNNFYYKKDRLNQLRGFCALVQEGTIVKAGQKIGVENATISKQIKALERDLKVSLFVKNKIRDRLVLSEEGRKFYERAISIVQETESLYKEFSKDVEDGKNNTLRIVSRDIIIEKMLPFIVEFKKKNPEAELYLYNSFSKEESYKKLINDEVDLVLYSIDEIEECPLELTRQKIVRDTSYLVLYKGHPLEKKSEKSLTKLEIAKPSSKLYSNYKHIPSSISFSNFLKEYKIKSPINIEYAPIHLIKELIRNKICIAFINEILLTKQDRKDFILKNDENIFPPMFFYYFYKKNTTQKDIAKKFLELIEINKGKIFH